MYAADASTSTPDASTDDAALGATPADTGPISVRDAGMGDAGVGDAGDGAPPVVTAATCTSNTHWGAGNLGSPYMHPGRACLSCHGNGALSVMDLAGTVFPTAHEPDDCNGVGGLGVTVVITDANGMSFTLPVNAAGNFYNSEGFLGFGRIAKPFRVKVVSGGKERAMATPLTNGDCNGCHSQSGAFGAPGRVLLP